MIVIRDQSKECQKEKRGRSSLTFTCCKVYSNWFMRFWFTLHVLTYLHVLVINPKLPSPVYCDKPSWIFSQWYSLEPTAWKLAIMWAARIDLPREIKNLPPGLPLYIKHQRCQCHRTGIWIHIAQYAIYMCCYWCSISYTEKTAGQHRLHMAVGAATTFIEQLGPTS